MAEASKNKISTQLVPNIGRIPIPAYRGESDFIFVSYAHSDSDIVFPEMVKQPMEKSATNYAYVFIQLKDMQE